MSDYIPTTEEVRSAYADENQSYDDDWDDCVSQFDRWLAQNNAEVAEATEQRIIKLITDNDVIGSEWWIALIKGESK